MNHKKLICAVLTALLFWNGRTVPVRAEQAEAPGAETRAELSAEPEKAGEESQAEPSAGEGASASMDWFEEKGLTLGESSVAYPAIREGCLTEVLREKVNERILEDGNIREYVTRVSQLISGGRMNVAWRGTVLGPVFSFEITAEGAVTTPRPDHVRTGGNIDLRDGHEIAPEEILKDPDAAMEMMESYLEEEIAPELSAHLQNSQVTPLPERFRMTERGLIWMYSRDQLSTLSDRAGDLLVPWEAIQDQLDLSEGGILSEMGIARRFAADGLPDGASERIREMTDSGRIPGVPAALGGSMQELTDAWGMLTDPDVYVHGRMFALEGADFQGVFLQTDFLSESWEQSAVDGIRIDLGGAEGLAVGQTRREAWIQALGEPEHSIEMDEETAEAYRTVPGTRDYYAFGKHRLQLQADQEGVLRSIVLSE